MSVTQSMTNRFGIKAVKVSRSPVTIGTVTPASHFRQRHYLCHLHYSSLPLELLSHTGVILNWLVVSCENFLPGGLAPFWQCRHPLLKIYPLSFLCFEAIIGAIAFILAVVGNDSDESALTSGIGALMGMFLVSFVSFLIFRPTVVVFEGLDISSTQLMVGLDAEKANQVRRYAVEMKDKLEILKRR